MFYFNTYFSNKNPYVFSRAHVCHDNPAMHQSNSMILGARESRDHQLSRAPKIIKIRRQVFAGDDFEKNICFQIIDEIPLILIGSPGKNVHGK